MWPSKSTVAVPATVSTLLSPSRIGYGEDLADSTRYVSVVPWDGMARSRSTAIVGRGAGYFPVSTDLQLDKMEGQAVVDCCPGSVPCCRKRMKKTIRTSRASSSYVLLRTGSLLSFQPQSL